MLNDQVDIHKHMTVIVCKTITVNVPELVLPFVAGIDAGHVVILRENVM